MFNFLKISLFVGVCVTVISCEANNLKQRSYSGYSVVRCFPQTAEHLKQLRKLAEEQVSAIASLIFFLSLLVHAVKVADSNHESNSD